MSNIYSEISTTVLRFNNSPVSFKVTVKNLSNNYASFKLNLTAAGADPNMGDSWYNLDPITSVLIPEGDTTKFSVTILKAPILGMDLINLEVKVSSLELPDINFHSLKLLVSPEPVGLLQVYLPVNSFAVYPRKIVDIPVRVSNPNHYQVDIVLRLIGLDSSWLERGSERRLLIGAGREGEIKFTCQSPIVKYTPCGIYTFTVKAYVNDEEWGQATGQIEILPIGTVFFSVTPDYNVLPSKASWLPQFQIEPATYQLELKNASNVVQNHITIAVEADKCDCQVIPPYGEAKLGETLNLKLEATKKRHWWGLKRKYPVKITPSLSDLRLNTTDPSSKNVELLVHPLLPLWLQLGLGAFAIIIILWLLSITGHSDRVNSVTFSSDINPILSGSEDGTVREWKATPDHVFCKWLNWQGFCLQHQDILLDSKKTGDLDSVNVVKLRSDHNVSGKFAFLGFDSGKASKLNILTQEETRILDNQDSSNRVLDIIASPDFKTVFLGRGTKLLQWNSEDNSSQDLIPQNISIHVLTLTPDHKSIIAGGQFNKIFLINLSGDRKYQSLNLHPLINKDADQITGLKITKNNILISTDNRGLIQIWDFNKCRQGNCERPLYSNQGKEESGINAIALIQDEQDKYYLVTGDTEGKINIWSFIEDFNSVDLQFVQTIANYSQPITSLDIIHEKNNSHNRLLILSGNQDSRVRLDIYNIPQ
ncbi:MAG: hypothetical protein QNJ32_22180 [Xenococcaceae cyanobacterium MO_167.B27]|nr:hypothetical protein [Xenococcaceae cyanobacterium MO_167.B27]